MNSSKSCSICHQIGHNRRTCKSSTNECPICLEPSCKEKPLSPLPCGHYFHTKCVESWITQGGGCPICRDSKKRKSEDDDWNEEVGEGEDFELFEDFDEDVLLDEIDELLEFDYREITRSEIFSQFKALPEIIITLSNSRDDILQWKLACTYVSNMIKAYLFQEYQQCLENGFNARDYCKTNLDNITRRLELQNIDCRLIPEYRELVSVIDTL